MYYVTPYIDTTTIVPEIAIPTNEGTYDDHSDDESQYESTLREERREDIVNNDSSEKSSDSESDSDQKNWVRHVTISGRKSGLPSGWLDPSTGGSMQPTAKPTLVAIAAVQSYYDKLQETDNDEMKL